MLCVCVSLFGRVVECFTSSSVYIFVVVVVELECFEAYGKAFEYV
jgi:hypothetical protein